MHRIAFVLVFLGVLLVAAPRHLLGQAATPPPATAELAERVRLAVEREFGPRLKLVAKFPPMFGDFDGDGKEDLAVVVTGNPMLDQASHNYKLIDPYDSYFGYGNVRTTMSFPIHAQGEPLYVAIAHDWRAPHPKAKFVIVNLPFERIEVGSVQMRKKKTGSGLFTVDSTGTQALVVWDGRKYRWQGGGVE
jgi:hypothetical protein